MKKIFLLFCLFISCTKSNFQITDKAYVSEHVTHVTSGRELIRKSIPQKFYLFHETGFSIERCETTRETWLETKINQKINTDKLFNCIYGAEASIRIIKTQ